ncbi:MAG: alpha-galactosidase [Planctomycetaceae bacterium]|nr:alpha-galactosidase [Planctomycetaceae bacterium]
MKKIFATIIVSVSSVLLMNVSLWAEAQQYVLENDSLKRIVTVTDDNILQTTEITNKLNGVTTKITNAPEFRIRLSNGTDKPETAFTLNSADFTVSHVSSQQDKERGTTIHVFFLKGKKIPMTVAVHYYSRNDDGGFFMRKHLKIALIDGEKNVDGGDKDKDYVLERIDVEVLGIEDAYQPYTVRAITARAGANWNPGLGQPLYGAKSALFFGIEFPAADNRVDNGELIAGYLYGKTIKKGENYKSYSAVTGAADDPAFVRDALFAYIEKIRRRPLRLQVQYNSWFDLGSGDRNSIAKSITQIHKELVDERGCRPLNAYVIDDGWQDTNADWSDKVWKVNTKKFDEDFAGTQKLIEERGSKLGLWLSPGCLFGSEKAARKMKEQGFETLDPWMSMAGPKYMDALESRMAELAQQRIGFFKLDGIFGHLNTRNFEIHGSRYGLPEMPQLEIEGFTASDERLNNKKYDELKIYYLSAGTERLIQLFERLGKIKPDIYIVISNGSWLSPWWLTHIDSVWMINAGDAADGSSRNDELVYRDGRYHDFHTSQHAQFPLYAIFNHEPKKLNANETKDIFRKYLYMNLSRGTGFVEMYIKPSRLADYDWDVLAEGLQWTYEMFPTFRNVKMHGGNPKKNEVYGYTAWNNNLGYISLHNPSDKPQQYSVKLDRAFGLPAEIAKNQLKYYVNSPLDDNIKDLPETIQSGTALNFQLAPKEMRLICFSTTKKDWANLKALQKRTTNDYKPQPPVPVEKAKD